MKRGNTPHSNEEQYHEIIGWMIHEVHYTEVDLYPASPRPYFRTDNPRLHTVDMALHFSTTMHQKATLLWKEKNPMQHGVYLVLEDVKESVGQRTWNVSAEPIWQEFIGNTITGVEIMRARLDTECNGRDTHENTTNVQSIALHFSNGKTVFVSAAELPLSGQGKAILGANNLLVTDDETLAQQCEMLSQNLHEIVGCR